MVWATVGLVESVPLSTHWTKVFAPFAVAPSFIARQIVAPRPSITFQTRVKRTVCGLVPSALCSTRTLHLNAKLAGPPKHLFLHPRYISSRFLPHATSINYKVSNIADWHWGGNDQTCSSSYLILITCQRNQSYCCCRSRLAVLNLYLSQQENVVVQLRDVSV